MSGRDIPVKCTRPILFSGPMMRALLDGRKTQTRRIVKGGSEVLDFLSGGPDDEQGTSHSLGQRIEATSVRVWCADYPEKGSEVLKCPHGVPGDRLWVRETWQHGNHPLGPFQKGCPVFYRADYMDDPHGPDGEKSPEGRYRSWRPAIHMPRAASRIDLEITHVYIERLQQISEADAIAEGMEHYRGPMRWVRYLDAITGEASHSTARDAYFSLWEFINGPSLWNANPWVWVIEFAKLPEAT